MYHNYFGLKEQAFSIAVNPRYLYMSQQHKEALAHLLYGVKGGGFVLLSGEVGTGKTTIIRCLLEQLPENTDIAIIMNPMDDAIHMLATICEELSVGYDKTNIDVKSLTDSLNAYLLENHRNGRNTVLLIDEAQRLSAEALEQIRLLTNLETTTQKLLQIILVGQPELNDLLAQPRLRQLSQRITARFHLTPLTLLETQAYIAHRLEVAGMPEGRNPFPALIVRKIHRFTGGIPRLINIVCERTLIGAYGHNKPVIDNQIFKLACSEVAGSMEYLPARLRNLDWRLLGGITAAVMVCTLMIYALFVRPNGAPQAVVQAPAAPVVVATVTPSPAPTPIPVPSLAPRREATNPELADPSSYLIESYTEAQAKLLRSLGYRISYDTHPCWELTAKRIECTQATLETWDALETLNRPSVLILTTPQRFTSHAVIVGLGQTHAELLDTSGNPVRVPLSELGPLWTGRVFYLWTKPKGFNEPLVLGQRSGTVKWLAEQFAFIDERDTPLTTTRFNSTLQERVKIFQRNQGLKDDGIIGEQTLMKVNEVLGIDKTLKRLD